MFRVCAPFGLIPALNDYFRAPETTIEVSRGQLRIYGIDGRREWIVVRTLRKDREFQLADEAILPRRGVERPGRGGSYPEVGRASPTGPAVIFMLICEYAHNDRVAL
jgi:hypothetical protein